MKSYFQPKLFVMAFTNTVMKYLYWYSNYEYFSVFVFLLVFVYIWSIRIRVTAFVSLHRGITQGKALTDTRLSLLMNSYVRLASVCAWGRNVKAPAQCVLRELPGAGQCYGRGYSGSRPLRHQPKALNEHSLQLGSSLFWTLEIVHVRLERCEGHFQSVRVRYNGVTVITWP